MESLKEFEKDLFEPTVTDSEDENDVDIRIHESQEVDFGLGTNETEIHGECDLWSHQIVKIFMDNPACKNNKSNQILQTLKAW